MTCQAASCPAQYPDWLHLSMAVTPKPECFYEEPQVNNVARQSPSFLSQCHIVEEPLNKSNLLKTRVSPGTGLNCITEVFSVSYMTCFTRPFSLHPD